MSISNLIAIDCSACKSEKSMVSTKVSRMSGIVRFIGWLIVIPSALGVLFSLVLFISSIIGGGEVVSQSAIEAEAAGAAIGATIGAGFSVLMGISALIGGLIGYLLIMKKKVYKCSTCGFIMDRA